jgi:putative tricarboxylic transport membrane protein
MKKDYAVPIVLVGFSIFVMVLSYKLGLETFRDPGPGLLPFVVALLLLLTCLYLLLSVFLRKAKRHDNIAVEMQKPNLRRVALVSLSIFIYALLLEGLGFLISSSMLLMLLFMGVGYKWRFALLTSFTIIVITYFFFTYLGVRFPAGIFKTLGFMG